MVLDRYNGQSMLHVTGWGRTDKQHEQIPSGCYRLKLNCLLLIEHSGEQQVYTKTIYLLETIVSKL